MSIESSESKEEGKITDGNQQLLLNDEDDVKEMVKKAAWSVSSCKSGNGVSALCVDNLSTYLKFCFYVDFKLDESYTPCKISIPAGDGFHSLKVGLLLGEFAALPFQFRYAPRISVPAITQTSTIFRCSTLIRAQPDKLEQQSVNRMFILGMGFVGQTLAEELQNQDWVVSGTCTNVIKRKEVEERGFDAYLFNANDPELMILNTLKDYTHLLVSIPPLVGIGDPMLQHGELLRSTLRDGHLKWLGYLSSTGVYGHCDGAWVDEDYPPNPTTELAKLRLAAEEGWLNLGHDLGLSTQVFRFGGIYGPGRSVVDMIIKQVPLSDGQKMRRSRQYTSRIHVDDICQVLKASIDKPSFWNIYNVVDDDPAPREEVFAYAMDLVEKKWPSSLKQIGLMEKTESLIEKISSRGEKRVNNARIKKELGVRLRHPSYKSGLQSIIDQMDSHIKTVP